MESFLGFIIVVRLDQHGLNTIYSVSSFKINIKNKRNAKEYVLEGRKQKPKYGLELLFIGHIKTVWL
jgi:hypothetical protein